MAEPKRIHDEDTAPPDITERRPPSRDADPRRPLLKNEPPRNAQSDPVLLPEKSSGGNPSPAVTAENRNVAEPAPRRVRSEPQTDIHQSTTLFADADIRDYRSRWGRIQTAFVDEPRRAVEDADNLVKSTLSKLSEVFTHERERLANQWELGDNVSTEDLRITLQRYRSFFDRLLN